MIDLITYINPDWTFIESYDVDGNVTKREYYRGTVIVKSIDYAYTKKSGTVSKIIPTYKIYNEGVLIKTVIKKEIIPADLGEVVINKETTGAIKGIKI